jgi:tetrahydromethanopterin S-methyltransferase subunit H
LKGTEVWQVFNYSTEQIEYEISGVKVGGQPGVNPTVGIPSIFFTGHSIVQDDRKGTFKAKTAEKLVNRLDVLRDETGIPYILDVVGNYPEALTRYVDWVAEKTDVPFLVDGITASVRIPVARHCSEAGLGERAIYNSISPDHTEDEIEVLKDLDLEACILLTFDKRVMSASGRLDVVKKDLLPLAKEIGFSKFLVDTMVLDVPSIGTASKACYLVKEELGLPAGCGASNATTQWDRIRQDRDVYRAAHVASTISSVVLGADFVMYGPIGYAPWVTWAIAAVDAFAAYQNRWEYRTRPVPGHPLTKIFR